jgi:hypothetical protein
MRPEVGNPPMILADLGYAYWTTDASDNGRDF